MLPRLNRDRVAVLAALIAPLAISAALVPFRDSFANTDAALVLVLVVVAIAVNGHRLAGILAALSAAFWFDFFLTAPYERFTITRRADIETTILLLVVGVSVSELAVWGRRQHALARQRAGYLAGIYDAAEVVASGGSPTTLIENVCDQLTRLLELRAATFNMGSPGAAAHRAFIMTGVMCWTAASGTLSVPLYCPARSNCSSRAGACSSDVSCSAPALAGDLRCPSDSSPSHWQTRSARHSTNTPPHRDNNEGGPRDRERQFRHVDNL